MTHTLKPVYPPKSSLGKMIEGEYLKLGELLALIPRNGPLKFLLTQHWERMAVAQGSSHNHQNWPGGYLDHIVETMNIACQMYQVFSYSKIKVKRLLPFTLDEALVVLFLHDLEKPFKVGNKLTQCPNADCQHLSYPVTKENRKKFRNDMINQFGIQLSDEQWNALQYVEGVPDSEYSPGERTLGKLAAFCHMADIASARLWYDRGQTQEW